MTEKIGPFAFVNEINSSKRRNLIHEDSNNEKAYNPYVINRQLSYFIDTIMFANEMNANYNLPKKLQNDFLLNIIRPGKRFSKWVKPEQDEVLDLVKEFYNCSTLKAKQLAVLLNDAAIAEIKQKLNKGGVLKSRS